VAAKGTKQHHRARLSSKWCCLALCPLTSCGRTPAEACAVRGLQVQRQGGKDKPQGSYPSRASALEHEHKHDISLRGRKAGKRMAAHHIRGPCCRQFLGTLLSVIIPAFNTVVTLRRVSFLQLFLLTAFNFLQSPLSLRGASPVGCGRR